MSEDDELDSARGSLTITWMSHWGPWHRLWISRDRMTVKRLGGSADVVWERVATEAVEFERVRLPFIWTTCIHVRPVIGAVESRPVDESGYPWIFVPVRPRRLRRSLRALGWPVVEAPAVTLMRPIRKFRDARSKR